jgi:hypothetical protein
MLILSPSSTGSHRLPRPARAMRLPIVALIVLAAFPASALAQGTDALDLPTDVEAVDLALEAGGAVAFAETAPDLEPAPVPAPAPAPTTIPPPPPASPPAPALQTPSETATAPAPESDLEGSPVNINVDVRILSPGDNGDVTQEIVAPGGGISAPVGTDEPAPGSEEESEIVWNWIRQWMPACEADMRASSAETTCGAALTAEELLSELQGSDSPDFSTLVPEAVEATPVSGDTVVEGDFLVRWHGRRGGDSRSERANAGPPTPAHTESANYFSTVAGDGHGGPPVGSPRPRATQGRRQSQPDGRRAPEQASPVLPSAVAAGSSGGGGAAPLGAALLALLCLLAPRLLGLAGSPSRKLSSQLSSSRLERPG